MPAQPNERENDKRQRERPRQYRHAGDRPAPKGDLLDEDSRRSFFAHRL